MILTSYIVYYWWIQYYCWRMSLYIIGFFWFCTLNFFLVTKVGRLSALGTKEWREIDLSGSLCRRLCMSFLSGLIDIIFQISKKILPLNISTILHKYQELFEMVSVEFYWTQNLYLPSNLFLIFLWTYSFEFVRFVWG